MKSSNDRMTNRTRIVALFDNYGEAASGVRAVEESGVPPEDISLVSHDVRDAPLTSAEGAGVGGGMGAAIGGGAGLLAALGVISVPGLGPVVAAGWVAATIVGAAGGAAAGGLIGAMAGTGESEDDQRLFADNLRNGGAVVTVQADARQAPSAEQILKDHHAVAVKERGEGRPDPGWTGLETEHEQPTPDEPHAE